MLIRRARTQRSLLAALLAVAMAGATLTGACALLFTSTMERAAQIAISQAAPEDLAATAYIGVVDGPDAASVAHDTRDHLVSAFAPFEVTTTARAWSAMRSLATPGAARDDAAKTYLYGMDDLPARAVLTAGRWPQAGASPSGPRETVLLEDTARLLGITVNSTVHIGAERNQDPLRTLDVTVVGLVRPRPGAGWDRDPLAGAGFDPAHQDGGFSVPTPTYGPFLVELADLLASGATVSRMEVAAAPDIGIANRPDLDRVRTALAGNAASLRLGRVLDDRVRIQRVASDLPQTFLAIDRQQQVTAAVVLAVALLCLALTGTALVLAGRLAFGVRSGETTLVTSLGFSGSQRAAGAALEAVVLAVIAAAFAVPASSALHSGLTHLAPLADAGLAAPPAVTVAQVLAVAGFALALTAALTAVSTMPVGAVNGRRQRELLARAGFDVLLLAFAAVGWWQLRTQPTGAVTRPDAIRVVAPMLLLTAGAAVALRLANPVLRLADRNARRSRGLMLPLAAFEAARRPQAVATGLLVGLACAAGTFGIAFDATWQRSQHDQADLAVGADLAITLDSAPATGDGGALIAATGGQVTPVTSRNIVVGDWLGGALPPQLVAVDTTRADALLRGRLDGDRSWADVGASLMPPDRVTGIPVAADATFTVTGTTSGPAAIEVTPSVVLQDATGLRTTCTSAPIRLDGVAHPFACPLAEGLQLVAVSLPVTATEVDESLFDPADVASPSRSQDITVTVTVPAPAAGAAGASGSPWSVRSLPPFPEQLSNPTVSLRRTVAGTDVTMTAAVALTGPFEAARELLAAAFTDPGQVPVAVSSHFADALGAQLGSRYTITVGLTAVPVVVREIVPSVPSLPGAAAVLADLDTLSRAVTLNGGRGSIVDAWWVGQPTEADAATRVAELGLGTVVTRAGEAARLTQGPVRAALPAALRLLVAAAVVILLVGVILHVTSDLQARAVEMARLRGLGMYRREIRRVLVGQHVGVLLPLVVAGTAVGALANLALAPPLIRSDTGALAFPPAVPVWPWTTVAAYFAISIAGCVVAATVIVAVQARRADAAHLRIES